MEESSGEAVRAAGLSSKGSGDCEGGPGGAARNGGSQRDKLAWGAAVALAVLGSSLWLLILDRIVTAATSGSGEDLIGARGLLSLFGALTVFQIAVAASWLLVRGVGAWVGRVTGGWRWRVLASSCAAGALASFPFHLVGEELSSGDWISQQPYAWVVHLAICAGGALAIAAVAGLDAAAGAGTGAPVRWRVALQVGALVASVALAWFDVTVWFSLYPHLHIATYLLSALLSFVAFRALTEQPPAGRAVGRCDGPARNGDRNMADDGPGDALRGPGGRRDLHGHRAKARGQGTPRIADAGGPRVAGHGEGPRRA
jgi:hypothetical protein